jgi:hypothetical protein
MGFLSRSRALGDDLLCPLLLPVRLNGESADSAGWTARDRAKLFQAVRQACPESPTRIE